MQNEFPAVLRAVIESSAPASLRVRTMDAYRHLGIGAAYMLSPVVGDRQVGRVLTSIGMPPVFERHYASRLQLFDPLPDLAARHGQALYWSAAAQDATLTPREGKFLRLLARFGMPEGLAIVAYGPSARCGFAGLTRPLPGWDWSTIDRALLQAVTQASYARYCALTAPEPDRELALSGRELQVLYWIALGKSNGVIAEILGISAPTVDSYVRRIFTKLGVSDRTTAAMAGVARGLVVVGDFQRESERVREANLPR